MCVGKRRYSALFVFSLSWPLLIAACALRLHEYWPDPSDVHSVAEPEMYTDIRAAVTFSATVEADVGAGGEVEELGDDAGWQPAVKRLLSAHPTEVLKMYTRLPPVAKLSLLNVSVSPFLTSSSHSLPILPNERECLLIPRLILFPSLIVERDCLLIPRLVISPLPIPSC